MYAVVKTGGKQYRVAAGEKLKVETLPAEVGAEVVLDHVLMVGDGESARIGQALLEQVEQLFTWWHRVRDGTLRCLCAI